MKKTNKKKITLADYIKAIKSADREIEKEISALEEEEQALSASLSDPSVTSNFALLSEKCARLEQIKLLSDRLLEEYETLI